MTRVESVSRQIRCLLEQGTLAKARCAASLLSELRPLLDAGVIVEERSGTGRCLVVRDPDALLKFSQARFPDVAVSLALGTRVTGVARFRDSKIFASDSPEVVLARAWQGRVLRKAAERVDVAGATTSHGVFAFLLKPDADYQLQGGCALVENPIVFSNFEHLNLPVGCVLYGQGRASGRLIDWLARQLSPSFDLLHLPDYDPAGLNEFERLRARLGNRVRLHLPMGLDQSFNRFSNPRLLEAPRSRAMLAELRKSASPEVREVVVLVDRHNAGLEQEALLVAREAT